MPPLEQKLNQLTLSTMSRHAETTLTEAAARNLSASATLQWLADMEPEARKQRALERRYQCARLQAQPSIDAFPFQHHKTRQQAKPRILRLLDLEFLTKGTNLVLMGNPGVGKSFLAKKSSPGAPVRPIHACSSPQLWTCSTTCWPPKWITPGSASSGSTPSRHYSSVRSQATYL
jgi:IstB-like ATP binding protein